MQSRTLLILLTIALLTACAPTNITTSPPTITAQPPTATTEPSPTITVTSTARPTEVPATPEAPYNFSWSPNQTEYMSRLTTLEELDTYSKWVKDTCKPIITMPAENILMLGPTDEQNSYLTAHAKDISRGYNAARNNQLCDKNLVTVDMELFGLTDKNPGIIVPYYFKTTDNKLLLLKFIMSKKGLAQMHTDGFFFDKTGPHLAPINVLPKSRQITLGLGEGLDDISSIYKGEDFYKAQGLDINSIPTMFKRIEETQQVTSEDAATLEGTIWLPWSMGQTSYSN